MTRLFIALPIAGEIITSLSSVHSALANFSDVLKVVEPSQYHLTLKFIGDCEGSTSHAMQSQFHRITPPVARLDYAVKGMGMFPNTKNPTVIWTGIQTDEKAMSQLAQDMQAFAKKFGIKEESRTFTPHLTLARIRKGRKLTEKINESLKVFDSYEFGSAVFDRVVLYSSKLTPRGPVYTELEEIIL